MEQGFFLAVSGATEWLLWNTSSQFLSPVSSISYICNSAVYAPQQELHVVVVTIVGGNILVMK